MFKHVFCFVDTTYSGSIVTFCSNVFTVKVSVVLKPGPGHLAMITSSIAVVMPG